MRETYPLDLCKHELPEITLEKIENILNTAKDNDTIKKGKFYEIKLSIIIQN